MAEIKIYSLENESLDNNSDEQSLATENGLSDLEEKDTNDIKGGIAEKLYTEKLYTEKLYGGLDLIK